MHGPRALADAIREIAAAGAPRPVVEVASAEGLGQVLAADVIARRPLPPWPNAQMDGYAVRRADVLAASAEAPRSLRVVATLPAGTMPAHGVGPGDAIRIFTGAPMPEGADAVIRWEDTDRGDAVVRVLDDRDARAASGNVRPAGEDASPGVVAMPAGLRLGPGALQWAAALGRVTLPVHRAPRIAVVRSGHELVPAERAWEADGARIVDSNGVALAAIVRAAGGEVVDLGIVPDDLDALRDALARGAAEADCVVSAGGIAAGDFDLAKAACAAAGGTIAFWKIRARPGSQVAFGEVRGTPWLGLPGNPVSATLCGELLLRPLVRVMRGDPRPHRALQPVTMRGGLAGDPAVARLVRVTLDERDDGRWDARSAGGQASHLVGPLARAQGLVVLPAGDAVADGGTAWAVRLDADVPSARVPVPAPAAERP